MLALQLSQSISWKLGVGASHIYIYIYIYIYLLQSQVVREQSRRRTLKKSSLRRCHSARRQRTSQWAITAKMSYSAMGL
jgi:hypothetical protein